MDSSYWKRQAESLERPTFNAGDYYNQSFVDRLKAAQTNIDNLVKASDQANSKVQESQDAYDTFKGEMRHYSEISKNQENDFGVKTAMDNYNQSKDAVAATQAAINALPSSINANSNRVLTQSQRNAAYQAQYSVYSRRMGLETSTSSEYEKVWQQARTNAVRAAAAEYAGQQQTLMDFNKAWTAALNNWNTAKSNVLKAQTEYSDIESQYRSWQRRQYNDKLARYIEESNRLNKLYISTLQNETSKRLAEIQSSTNRALADSQVRLAQEKASIHDKYSGLLYATNKLSDWYKKEYSNSIILNSML
jgi:hypothetical protein